jgi:hypothetical protein
MLYRCLLQTDTDMDSNVPPYSRSALCSLPIECRQTILGHLPDLQTLKAAILSHSALYSAFIGGQGSILQGIMLGMVSPELLPDAVFAFNSSRLEIEPWTREKVLSIIDEHQPHRIPPSFKWTPHAALKIQESHEHVRFFTSDFSTAALSVQPALPAYPLSTSEWCRVARSFYRFEIYTHLFKRRDVPKSKSSPDFDYEEQWDIYYQQFAAWELEQIVCVSEHLFRRIAVRM